ncbi:MAG: hypothetical protein FD180_2641 [Planctomycetota bacterium]|nr:MAG: hypothetical protein FD180_2641 [Planctomycetota bacterium]
MQHPRSHLAISLRALALVAVLPLAACAEDAGEYRNEDHGFRIRKPEGGWELAVGAPHPGTNFTLKAWRKGATGEESVTVFVTDLKGITGAAAACDAAEAARRADSKCSGIRRGTREVAGEDAPWLAFEYESGGLSYTLRQHYFVRHDAHFIVQCASTAARFKELEKEFTAVLGSFEFIELKDPEGAIAKTLLKKAAERCGSEIDWASSWKQAAARAKKQNRLVVVVVEQYRGLNIERYAPSTLFMDSDVVALMNSRFVAFQWNDRCGAPFEDPEVYGLGPSTFGQGILFADAEGKIVANAVSYDPFYFDDFARGVLRDHPGEEAEDEGDAEELLQRGDLDAAAVLLAAPESAEQWRLRASLLRRQRKGDEALKAIAEARAKGAKSVDLDEAVIRLRMGKFAEAGRLLAGNDEPEAVFWHALAKGMQVGLEPVREEVLKLAKDHPGDRWAWRAAAMMSGKGMGSGLDRAVWHEDARVAGCMSSPPAPGEDAASAERDAVAFLLKTQLRDGSWPSPHSLAEPKGAAAVAVASIAGSGLLPFRERKDVEAAVRRGQKFVLENPLVSHPDRLFDYTIWGQVFSLRFLAECAAAKFGDVGELVEAMDEIVAELRRGRFPDGGWAYFRAEGSEGTSIGFVTAAAVCALREAKAAGAEVPAKLVSGAVEVVASARQRGGAFNYFRGAGGDPGGREAEAALRSPLYAMVLKRAGEGKVEGLRESLDLYMRFREHNRRERGKNLCHTSPEGLASYYLIFGYSFAAEALSELPEKERAGYAAALTEDVLAMRTEDGAFCDNPSIGRHYGAGMALRAIRLARVAK